MTRTVTPFMMLSLFVLITSLAVTLLFSFFIPLPEMLFEGLSAIVTAFKSLPPRAD